MNIQGVYAMSEVLNNKVGQDLPRLYDQMRDLRNQVEDHYQKALEWKAKRDELNRTISQLAPKLKEEREQRNHVNEKVAELKVMRQGFGKELEEAENVTNGLLKQRNELVQSLEDNPDLLRERIKKLEWFLQTNVLSISKENEIVKEISGLEKKLIKTKAIDGLDNKLNQVTDRVRAIRGKINEYKNQMMEQVNLSQNHHTVVIDLAKQIAVMKGEADNAHEKYLEEFGLASQSFSDLRKIRERIREISEKAYSEKFKKKDDRVRDIEQRMESVANQAFEKVKKGSKITMDELSALVDKGFFKEETRN